jgi:hypothetical protein
LTIKTTIKPNRSPKPVLFAKILYKDAGRFYQPNTMQKYPRGHQWGQLIPDLVSKIFYGTKFALHERDIQVEVFMI